MPSPRAPRDSRDSLTLPSRTICLKALSRWVARACIEKHIIWHCARHSCGTNLLSNGANIASLSTSVGISSASLWRLTVCTTHRAWRSRAMSFMLVRFILCPKCSCIIGRICLTLIESLEVVVFQVEKSTNFLFKLLIFRHSRKYNRLLFRYLRA